MGSSSSKINLTLSRSDVPEILRTLALGFETGTAEIGGSSLDFSTFGKMKLGFKESGTPDTLTVSIRLKPRKAAPVCTCEVLPCTCGAAEAVASSPEGDGYKSVKKRLKKAWNVVKDALALGGMPDQAVLQAFTADFTAMLAFPGKGDPEYPANAEALKAFLVAAEAGDHDRASAAAAEIERLKKACHKMYK